MVGAGGAVAILLTARRQRAAEITLEQKDRDQADRRGRTYALQERVAAETQARQERVAAATEQDAAQRRVTELYTAAPPGNPTT